MECIGMITIGQSPRDDLVPFMAPFFRPQVRILQGGGLDGLSPSEIAALGPTPGEVGIVARLRDGSNTMLSHTKILPRVQGVVERLQDEGAQLLVIMCGADWSAIRSKVLVVNPGKIFPAVVAAVAGNRKLGVIKPSPGQMEQAKRQFADRGVQAHVTAASPYTGAQRLVDVRRAAEELAKAEVDLVWMSCVGMDEAMRDVVCQVTQKPVILARTILARVIGELIAGG